MEVTKARDFRTRERWRAWLERHAADTGGAWLVLYKKGSPLAGLRYPEALEEALCFGWIDSQGKRLDEDRFYLRFSPRSERSPWSEANRKAASRLVKEGRMAPQGMRKISEAKRSGRWAGKRTPGRKPAVGRYI